MRASPAFLLAACLLFPAGAMAGPAAPLPLSQPPLVAPAKLVCGKFDGKFKCKNVKDGTIGIEFDDGRKKGDGGKGKGGEGGGGGDDGEDNDGADGGGDGAADDADGEEAEGCPPDYKVLNPPSKFGPCEPPEGLPNNAYVQCPPGATGTPPNCVCPGQSEYGDRGNKCVAKDGGAMDNGGGGDMAGDADGEEADGCPPGYNVLNPPSKFGPCEPPEGLPNAAYKVCPAGASGTPPDCVCPAGSNYGTRGNKCVP